MIATCNRKAMVAAALGALLLTVAGCQATPEREPEREADSRARPPAEAQDASRAQKPKPRPAEPGTADGEDLWAAIREGFALDHEIDHPRVRAEIESLTRYPGHLLNMRERLELYLPHVFEQVRNRGFPTEVALLPIIESGMNPQAEALSGPAGLWQFIAATADRLGLPRNWWYDGRRDPALSTRAALDYLEYLYDRFGDWRLAIVAYNTGEGTVTRALAGKREPVSFWELRLPHAGMVFVPKLLALAEVVANPDRYGVTLPRLQTGPTFTTLPTGGQIDVAKAAAALGIDVETLYLLNPALNRSATPPEGPHQLNVPANLEDEARTWLASLDRSERVGWDRIEVRRGDTLGAIARRHSTDVRTLRQINNLPNDRLRAGQSLFVPAGSARGGSGDATVAAAAAQPAKAADGHSAGAAARQSHVVRSGDTLWGIARAYRIPVDRLVAANDLRPGAVLRIGQRLVIPRA
jgi:membrane-bound lytic murein transglycosylase D